jgi:hypothetical protein
MSTLDIKAHLRDSTQRAHRLLTNDLKAIAADQTNVCPGGCARPALHIVAECAAVNGMIATLLEGGEFQRPSPEDRERFFASFDTGEKALAFLDQETQRLLTVYENLDESTLADVSTQIGRPMTRMAMAELPGWHMMYHDGQLNYIQTLHGDSEMHWG